MKIIVFIALAALLVWIAYSWLSIRGLEEPAYEVLETREGYEIRKYAPYIVAEAPVGDDYRDGLNEGFRYVAGYIFGDNTTQESIKMTAPVIDAETSEKISMTVPVIDTSSTTRMVAFVLPSKYTIETLPQPNNQKVTLREVPAQTIAARRFTWYATEGRVQAQKDRLLSSLEQDGIAAVGDMQAAYYNPPLSMPLLLRNEVLVSIEYFE